MWLLLSTASFAAMSILVKLLGRLPTWEIVFFRSFINFLWLLPWLREYPIRREWRREAWVLVLRGVSGCVSMTLMFYAIQHMHVADALMLNYSSPIYVLILSALVLGERLATRSIVCVAVAFVGVTLILKPDFQVSNLAGLAGFISAIIAGVAYTSIKIATRTFSSRYIVFTFAGVASTVSFIPMLFTFVSPTPIEWLYLGLCGTIAAFAQSAMTKGYAGLPASVAAPLQLITVIFAATFAWILWGELPDFWSICGSILVAFGLIGAYRWRSAVR